KNVRMNTPEFFLQLPIGPQLVRPIPILEPLCLVPASLSSLFLLGIKSLNKLKYMNFFSSHPTGKALFAAYPALFTAGENNRSYLSPVLSPVQPPGA
ncbi:MAG: hypothetical protein ACOCS8_02735, partial [Desulfovermiculus sp.]